MNFHRLNFLAAMSECRSPFRHLLHTVCAAGVFLGAVLEPAHSQTLSDPAYTQDFSGAAGTLPVDWVSFNNGVRVLVELNGSGSLNIGNRDTSEPGNSGTAFFTGDAGAITDGVVADASIDVVLTPHTAGNWIGVIGRAQGSSSYNPDGYYALLNASSGSMGIWSGAPTTGGSNLVDSALAWVALPNLSSGTQYRMILEMAGTELMASLYSLEAEVGVDDPIASVSTTHALYSSGVTGLFARHGGANRTTSYDTFSITVIPEPSVAFLSSLALGIGFLLVRASRQPEKTRVQP